MDDIVARRTLGAVKREAAPKRPSRAEAEAAVRTLLAWTGDNPDREGLRETPRRVTDAFEEYFAGYRQDPAEVLSKTFQEAGGYDDLVMLRDIRVESHCEHHLRALYWSRSRRLPAKGPYSGHLKDRPGC